MIGGLDVFYTFPGGRTPEVAVKHYDVMPINISKCDPVHKLIDRIKTKVAYVLFMIR